MYIWKKIIPRQMPVLNTSSNISYSHIGSIMWSYFRCKICTRKSFQNKLVSPSRFFVKKASLLEPFVNLYSFLSKILKVFHIVKSVNGYIPNNLLFLGKGLKKGLKTWKTTGLSKSTHAYLKQLTLKYVRQ